MNPRTRPKTGAYHPRDSHREPTKGHPTSRAFQRLLIMMAMAHSYPDKNSRSLIATHRDPDTKSGYINFGL